MFITKKTKNQKKAVIDPRSIFIAAEQYRAAAHVVRTSPIGPHILWPTITCSAFSLELYLKSLILLETGTPAEGHDLRVLFDKLKPKTQDAIKTGAAAGIARIPARFAQVARAVPTMAAQIGDPSRFGDFDTVLNDSSQAFKAFRYAFEGMTGKDQWMAEPITEAIRRHILTANPSWKAVYRWDSG